MTEAEWLACDDPESSLSWLADEKASARKLRLFCVACGRHIQGLLRDARSTNAIEVAERYADGSAILSELSLAWDAAGEVGSQLFGTSGVDANKAIDAADAAASTADEDVYACVHPVTNCAASAMFGTRKTWAAERSSQVDFLREIFGNPFRPVAIDPDWLTSTVTALAQTIYAGRAFDRLPILADALEESGCTDADVLEHCRSAGVHVRGCWVVDLVLGKS